MYARSVYQPHFENIVLENSKNVNISGKKSVKFNKSKNTELTSVDMTASKSGEGSTISSVFDNSVSQNYKNVNSSGKKYGALFMPKDNEGLGKENPAPYLSSTNKSIHQNEHIVKIFAKKIERDTGSPRMVEASSPSTKARHTAGTLSNNSIPKNSKMSIGKFCILRKVGNSNDISTVYNVGKMKEDTLPGKKIISAIRGSKANNVSSDNTIHQNDRIVNIFNENKKTRSSSKRSPQKALPDNTFPRPILV